jgi:DNA processing protein
MMGDFDRTFVGGDAASPDRERELSACLALKHTKGIGPRTWKQLLVRFGTAVCAVSHARQWRELKLATSSQETSYKGKTWQPEAEKEQGDVHTLGMQYLLFSDPEYPALLREIPDPPIILYVRGDLACLQRPCLAVVGSRNVSSYAVRLTRNVCTRLSQVGLCIVSGFACGVDRIAHEIGSRSGAGTIAVLGTGLDIIYPASNKDIWDGVTSSGLIISEFAPHTLPDARNFPYRNRLISGLSLGVLVMQAAARSGSLITARLALEQNREVFAVPGPVGAAYAGCHELIQSGAKLVQEAGDVLEEIQPLLNASWPELFDSEGSQSLSPVVSAPALELSPEERQIMQCLKKETKIHIDTLTQQLGWESKTVSQALIMMEMKHLVRQYPGMMYTLC